MLVHASSFSSTHSFVCLSCLLVFMVVWTFCSGGVSGFDPVYVFCCNVRSSYLFVSVTTCLLFTLLGPDHSECASGNALTDTAHTSPLGWNFVLQHSCSTYLEILNITLVYRAVRTTYPKPCPICFFQSTPIV